MSLKKFYYKKIRSTNDMALKHIAKGVEKGIIITDFQTKGKGQLKKIKKTNCKNVRDCLQKFTNYKIVVKQPNDLFINNQKICGILQETIFKKNKKFLVVGIGININKSPKIKNYPTNFINFFTAKKVKKFELFKKLSNVFEKKVNQFN